MLNIEKYKKEINAFGKSKYSNLILLKLFMEYKTGRNYNDISDAQVLDWLTEEYKEPILDEAEKEYLSSVIKPFRSRIVRICKRDCSVDNYYIKIILKPIDDDSRAEHIALPEFKKDVMMYKGMKADKRYSLEELGL